jgi:release factor glutamine methyltransferase
LPDILQDVVRKLQEAGIETARLDARLLLQSVLGVTREQLLIEAGRELRSAEKQQFEALVQRRLNREPMSQILGTREFWGLEFEVTKDTLAPRPDSETIIASLLVYKPNRSQPLSMLDLGTGTGCLLLSALSEYPQATGLGVDISEEALVVAEKNAQRLGLENRVEFKKSYWNSKINGVWDVVISNPPYIPTEEIPQLSPEVATYEPILALDGGGDGLDCYRAITSFLPSILAENGIALLEVGAGQANDVAALVSGQGLKVAQVAYDLAGIARCIIIQK